MSHQAVEKIIGRAVIDTTFREQLFTAPDQALAGADLTEDEKQALRGLSREKFDASLGQLEQLAVAGGDGRYNASTFKPDRDMPATPDTKFDWTRIGYAPSNTN